MPSRPPNSLYPDTSDLHSGDLLFPKKPGDTVIAYHPAQWSAMKLPNAFRKAGLRAEHRKMSVAKLLASTKVEDAQAQLYIGLWQSRLLALLDPTDEGNKNDWLDAIGDLLLPPFLSWGRALLEPIADTLGSWVDGLDFTVSHVAMAFEQGGQWYVMEAGCTDFSHYRVCISPYLDPDDAQRARGQARGWAQRRADLGQCVWSARHQGLQDSTARIQRMPAILNHCKDFLSVPYGILEPGMMGNPDRMYCAELLQRGFAQVNLRMDTHQTWAWVVQQLGTAFHWPFPALPMPGGRFPLLSPKMAYTDPAITAQFKPTDATGQDLSYV